MKTLSLDFLFFTGVIIALINIIYSGEYVLLYFIICGIVLLVFFLFKKGKKYNAVMVFLVIFSILFLVKTLYFQSVNHFSDFVLLISHFGYGIYLIEQKNAFKVSLSIYIILGVYISAVIISGNQLANISSFSSENMINYIALVFSVLLIGLYYLRNNIILISPAVFSVVISFISQGRAGMIASIILILSLATMKYKKFLNKFTLGLLFIFFTLSSYYLYNFIVFLVNNIITRFGERDTFYEDSPRSLIWQAYQNSLDVSKFIFGFDSKVYTFSGYSNLHNSFLDVHYTFGIGGLLIIILLIIILFWFFAKKEYLFFILLSVLLFRAMTDIIMLVGRYDFVLIFLVLLVNEKLYVNKSTTDKFV